MGIIDFVKTAGKKIFQPGEARRESAVEEHLASYGIRDIKAEVDDDKAILTGTAKDSRTRETAVLLAGNIEGISSVDDRIRVAHATPTATSGSTTSTTASTGNATTSSTGTSNEWTSRTYTVKSGDTLSKIAKDMYGDANKYPQIFEANKPMLKDPDEIYPGQVLRVPPEQ